MTWIKWLLVVLAIGAVLAAFMKLWGWSLNLFENSLSLFSFWLATIVLVLLISLMLKDYFDLRGN